MCKSTVINERQAAVTSVIKPNIVFSRIKSTKSLVKLHPMQTKMFENMDVRKKALLQDIADLESEMKFPQTKEQRFSVQKEIDRKLIKLSYLMDTIRETKAELYKKMLDKNK